MHASTVLFGVTIMAAATFIGGFGMLLYHMFKTPTQLLYHMFKTPTHVPLFIPPTRWLRWTLGIIVSSTTTIAICLSRWPEPGYNKPLVLTFLVLAAASSIFAAVILGRSIGK